MVPDNLHILTIGTDAVLGPIRAYLARQASAGWRTSETVDVTTALETMTPWPATPPDTVVLDAMLPDPPLTDALARLGERWTGTPVIVVLPHDDDALARTALAHAAQDVLVTNELDARTLRRAVRNAVERARSLRRLRESEERYALALRGSREVLWDWDMHTNSVYFSRRWQKLLGEGEEESRLDPAEWRARIHPEDVADFEARVRRHIQGTTSQLQHEHRVRLKSGGYIWLLTRGVAMRDPDGHPYRVVGSCTDITYRRRAEDRLRHRALHDELTDLPNRALFSDLLRQTIARSKRHPDHRFAVLFLDIDRFKVVNDSLGHSVGDQLLVLIARRLEECLRPEDTVARLGGDEFTVLVDGIAGSGDAVRLANRIQKVLAKPFELGGRETFTTASIGIALSSTGYIDAEEVLRDADNAMYRAKSGGKARYQLFDKKMHAQAMRLLHLETDLRHALERRELELFYQPIVGFESRDIVALEALVRWRHPTRGLLGPREFIPLAEENGLIVPLGQWVLGEACRQLREWSRVLPDARETIVSVNISGRQLAEPGLARDVETVLSATGLAPSRLRLEMTESVVMRNATSTRATLADLRDLGVHVAIDDFGTGYSSLSYLHRFPVDTLKIDRSFVGNLDRKRENLEIVKCIVSIANNLHLKVTAEGVETERQVELLQHARCTHGQGFLFHRPLPAAEALPLLSVAAA
jgi:diguanylate cyclase (GGDEF)-like protein/PAS domain S-box-containing protein